MSFPATPFEVQLLDAYNGKGDLDDLLSALMDSEVWIPLGSPAEVGRNTSVPVVVLDGAQLVPVYTSREQVEKAEPGAHLMNPPLREFVKALPEHVGRAVNPGGDYGMPVHAETLRQLRGDLTTIEAGTTVRIGEPAEEPEELLAALAEALSSVLAVVDARRCWAQVEGREPGLVIGLDIEPDNPPVREIALAAVGGVVRAASASDIDVVFSNDRDAFTDWMARNAEPFYVR